MSYDFDSIFGGEPAAQPQEPAAAPKTPAGQYDFDAIFAEPAEPTPAPSIAQAAIREASFVNPDEEAERRKLARRMQEFMGDTTPAGLLDMQDAQRRLRVAEADHATRASPRTSAFLSNAENAKIAADDAKTLARLEDLTSLLGGMARGTAKGATYDASSAIAGVALAPLEAGEQGLRALGLPEWMAQSEIAKAIRAMIGSAERMGTAFNVPEGETTIERGMLSGAQSLGQNLAVLPAGVAARSGELATRIMALMSGGSSYVDARAEGTTPLTALSLAAPDAVAEYATEKFGMKALFDQPAFKNAFLKQATKFAALEMGGEQVATVWQDFNRWMVLNPEKTLDEFIAERPEAAAQTAIATLVGAGGQVAVVRGLNAVFTQETEGARVEAGAQTLQELFTAAEQSLTRGRDTQTFDAFFQDVAGDATVFVDPVVLRQAAEQAGVAEDVLPSLAAQSAEASNVGPGVEVPVAELVSAFTGTGIEQQIIENVRMAPDAPTLVEARENGARAMEFFQAEAAKALEQATQQEEFRTAAETVETELLAEIKAAAPEPLQRNAEGYTKLVGAFYSTVASRMGITPLQLRDGWTDAAGVQHRGYRLGVLNEQMRAARGAAQQFDQSGRLITDTPAFKEWFGESKVVDAEGKPLVVYHGTQTPRFTEFMPGGAAESKTTGSTFGLGVYLTTDTAEASSYAGEGAVLPVYVTGNILDLGKVTESQLVAMSKWANENLIEADKARFSETRRRREFDNDAEALDFFKTQKANWEAFDGITTRGKPKAVSEGGKSIVEYTDYDAPVELKDAADVETLLKSVGWNSAADFGYDGVIVPKEGGRKWVIVYNPAGNIKSVFNRGTFSRTDPNILFQAADDFLTSFDVADMIEIVAPTTSEEEIDLEQTRFLSAFPEGSRYTRDTGLLKRVRLASEKALDALDGRPETDREVASALGPFSAHNIGAEVLDADSLNPTGSLRITVFGKEQVEAGLTDEPGLTITVGSDGELTLNGPAPNTKTFEEFQARGWADFARGADGTVQRGWTALKDPANPDKPLPIAQILPLLADTHARVREWRGEDYVGLHWTRATGALGGLFDQAESAVFFQEQAPNLVALHNLSAENLKFADEMGGLAVPSIGVVTRERGGVEGFGEITLIGDQKLADPGTEPVFSSDAYTARFPKPEWPKAKSKDAMVLVEMVRAAGKEFDDRSIVDETYDNMVNSPDAGRVVDVWLRSPAVQALFLREQGVDVKPAMGKRYLRTNLTEQQLEELRPLYRTVEDQHNTLPPAEQDTPEAAELRDKIREYLAQNLKRDGKKMSPGAKANIERIAGQSVNLLYMDYNNLREAVPVDSWATGDLLRPEIDKRAPEFKAWVEKHVLSKFSEPFLKDGRKRVPYTLPNIVEAMTGAKVKGQEKSITFGAGQTRAAASMQFRDIEEMREAAKSSIVNDDEYKAAKEKTEKLLDEYRTAVVEYTTLTDWRGQPDTWAAMDASMRAIAKWSTAKVKDAASMRKALQSEKFKVSALSADTIDKAMAAGRALLDAPVPYFEAKPQRAVTLNEFTGALVPANASPETRAILEKHGLRVREYSTEANRSEEAKAFAEDLGVLFQQRAQTQRGAFSPRTLDITFLANADASTFLHETGHFFLTVYADLASQPDAPAEIKADMDALLKWFNEGQTLEQWNTLGLEEQRPFHEQFAESFEQYLFSGRAPTKELQPLFRRFAKWLTQVYGSIRDFVTRNKGAKLNEEVSAIMDRMIATDAEIEAMRAARNYVQLFRDAAEAGMTPEDFAAYQALDPESLAEAEEQLRTRGLRDMKWLQNRRNKIIAELQVDAKEKRAAVREEVAKEVAQQPLYRAMKWLKRGEMTTPEGEEIKVEAGHKLRIADVEALFPTAEGVELRKLGYGRYGMLAEEGMHPDQVAEIFEGFSSGEALVRQLLDAPKFRDEVEGLTDQRMLEQYGDLASPQDIERAADEAIHNDARTRMVSTELHALGKSIGKPSVLMKAAREYARQIVETKSMKTLKPAAFAAEEVRAGKAAIEALRKGDRAEAANQKRRELLNHAAAKEAYAAAKEMDKIVARLRKIADVKDETAAKTRDMDMVNAVRATLAEFGIGRHGKRAVSYMGVLRELNPEVSEVLDDIVQSATENAQPIDRLPLSALRDLSKAVEDLWAAAARERQVKVEGKMLALDTVRQSLKDKLLEGYTGQRKPGSDYGITKAEIWKQEFAQKVASLKRPEAWIGMKDGADTYGPWRRYIWKLINDAQTALTGAKSLRLRQMKDLLAPVMADMKPRMIEAPELGYTFGKGDTLGYSELLHAMLHTGNGSNMRKLMIKRGWAELREDGTLNTGRLSNGRAGWDAFMKRMHDEGVITKKHWDFVQSVWDLMDDMRPDAQKAYREVYGRYFDEITAEPVITPFGTYRGGYVPARTDPRLQTDADMRALEQASRESMVDAFPTPRRGFTMARVKYDSMLELNLQSLTRHIDDVLTLTHMLGPIKDAQRILRGPVADALSEQDREALNYLITPWLQRASTQRITTAGKGGVETWQVWNMLRRNQGAALMFANVINTAQQLTGFFPALLKFRGGAKYLLHAAAHSIGKRSELAAHVSAMSPYMHERIQDEVHAMAEQMDKILLAPSKLQTAQQWSAQHAYFMQMAMDNTMSPIIWLAKYNQVMEEGKGGLSLEEVNALEKQAIELADSAVRMTQGAMRPIDVAAFEAGTPFTRMFTQFAGWFSSQINLIGEQYVIAKQMPNVRQRYARLGMIAFLGWYAPAVAGELIRSLFIGGADDEDKDGEWVDDWLQSILISGPVKYAAAFAPVVGQGVVAAFNSFNNKPYDDRLGVSPVVSGLEASLRGVSTVYKAATDEDYEPKIGRMVRDVGTLLSITTGVPVLPVAKSAGYLSDVAAEEVQPTSPADLLRGTITGVASPESKQ